MSACPHNPPDWTFCEECAEVRGARHVEIRCAGCGVWVVKETHPASSPTRFDVFELVLRPAPCPKCPKPHKGSLLARLRRLL